MCFCLLITLCLELFQNFSNDTLSLGVSLEISSALQILFNFTNIVQLYKYCSTLQILFNFTNIVQLYNLILQQKLHYFGIDNLMDMFCYVTSLLVLSITVIFIQVSKILFVQVVLLFYLF